MINYQQIIECLSTAVIVLDTNANVQYLNESAESLTQTSVNRAKNKPLSCLVCVDEMLQGAVSRCFDYESTIKLRDYDMSLLSVLDTRRVDCQLTPVSIDGQSRALMEIYEKGEVDREYLIKERLQSGHIMVKGLAHEIRNPLGGVRGAAQLLASELVDHGSTRSDMLEYTDLILREVDRLSDLVNQMQSTARVKIQESVNIHGVLEHVRHLVEPNLPNWITVTTDYDPSLPNVIGDEAGLVQAFLNIVQNAVESLLEPWPESPNPQGMINIQTRIDHRVLSANTKCQVVRVSIDDNGKGVDDKIFHHIFEPLVTSKAQGSGLGLSISSDVVRLHGGLIDVRSESGRTVFDIFLRVMETKNA